MWRNPVLEGGWRIFLPFVEGGRGVMKFYILKKRLPVEQRSGRGPQPCQSPGDWILDEIYHKK